MTDELQHLLRHADASAPPPLAAAIDAAQLAMTVRKRFVRRRVIRETAIAGALGLLIAIALIPLLTKTDTSRSPRLVSSTLSSAELKQQIASLAIQADIHTLTAEKLAAVKAPRPTKSSKIHDPAPDMQLQRDRAALILVYEANQHARQNRTADAIAAYRRTVELFPESRWAGVARQKLKEIES